jgi:high-affinity Fe2+/Pb2+ permease
MSGLRYAFLTLTAIISISLLFALPAAQPSVATTSCILTGTQISPGDCIASAIPLALIGIMLSLIFGAIVFMFGEVLNYQALKGLYKRELWETAKSAIIVAIVFSSLYRRHAIDKQSKWSL